jgi:hypothetical protein
MRAAGGLATGGVYGLSVGPNATPIPPKPTAPKAPTYTWNVKKPVG